MPKVGKMKFPYTEQGMKDAANYAKQSGKSMEIEEYGHGGMIPKYRGGGMVRRPMMPGRRPMMPGRPRRPMARPAMNPAMMRALSDRIASMKKGGKVAKPKYKKGGKVKK